MSTRNRILICLIFLTTFISLDRSYHNFAYAQENKPPIKKEVTVSASVGELYLSVSGYASPNASVVMTTKDGVFLRSGVADNKGNFSLPQVLIKKGFSIFCLTTVDFKRLGESNACHFSPPATGSLTIKDLFLPPTIGVARNEINEGSDAVIFGYSMPSALVTIYLNDGRRFNITADSTGYYEYRLKNLKAGVYQLFSTANWQGKQSLDPTKKIQVKALSVGDRSVNLLKNLLSKIQEFFTLLGRGPLWLAIPILILIIILILKLWPEKFTYLYESKLITFFSKRVKKKLHHWWWIGY